MRKYFLFLLAAHILWLATSSQNVGIGTNNPQNKLHVAGGLRLDTLVGVNGTGLLKHDANGAVYGIKFTGSTNDVLRGDGTFGTAGSGGGTPSNVWMLNGNAGTDPATNFIGTTDAQPLLFRVNNEPAGIIGYPNHNVGFGRYTLSDISSGVRNTANGDLALTRNTTGNNNTAIGYYSLHNNTTASENTALGSQSLNFNTTGTRNTAIGFSALYHNGLGSHNTASGYSALFSNTFGFSNTANGYSALFSNSTGSHNTASGYSALFSNTTGHFNTADGEFALYENTTGQNNTAIGASALRFNTTGAENTANGYKALFFNTTGTYNTANGVQSLYSNTFGFYNTANGVQSLYSNTTGYYNTANGYQSLYSNTFGSYNTANGGLALYSNTTGYYNTANGRAALSGNTTGNHNTAVGYRALSATTSAEYNTAIGYNAGLSSNHWNNVFVGANTDVSNSGFFNVIAIGQGTICTNSSQVTMGNGATNTYRAYANWTNISDGRYKKNVKEDVPGLSFITRLRPITYTLDATGLDNFLHKNQPSEKINGKAKEMMNKALREKEQITLTGFVAQEVERSAKELGFNFSGIDAPKNENDVYGLRYSEFVVPLVKAVQEQQAIIEKQQKQIDELIKELKAIKEKMK